jgi:hypothetical protein
MVPPTPVIIPIPNVSSAPLVLPLPSTGLPLAVPGLSTVDVNSIAASRDSSSYILSSNNVGFTFTFILNPPEPPLPPAEEASEVEDGLGLAVKLRFLGGCDADVELEDEREGAGVRR